LSRDELSLGAGIEREFFSQCDRGNTTLESIKLIAILIRPFQIVLNLLCKRSNNRSKESQEVPINREVFASVGGSGSRSALGCFVSENNSSTVRCATWRTASVLSWPAILSL
jgi:hypothetical protein